MLVTWHLDLSVRRIRSFNVIALEKSVNTSWISVIGLPAVLASGRGYSDTVCCAAVPSNFRRHATHLSNVVQLCSCSTELCTTRSLHDWDLSPKEPCHTWITRYLLLVARTPVLPDTVMLIAVDPTTYYCLWEQSERDKVRTEGRNMPDLSTQPRSIFETDLMLN